MIERGSTQFYQNTGNRTVKILIYKLKDKKSQIIILSTITNMAAKKYMSKNRFANKFGESYQGAFNFTRSKIQETSN